ncbi:hypothetical protein EAS61_39585 [Bradyrhizobium zhanjiangense]|uniref:Uncharacterized protein n=1 Tax=Bradyrhizobium zhanjiangense TaxID=1325107 RepID=A0A4Q0Q6E6_9BRAD|nr:hypothetical protein EAS61_39585 [Bradyrhizobium zhanjiangense]
MVPGTVNCDFGDFGLKRCRRLRDSSYNACDIFRAIRFGDGSVGLLVRLVWPFYFICTAG